MNDLRNEIVDAVIESVFRSFPGMGEEEFRACVCRMLGIIDHAVRELMRDERERRYHKTYKHSKN